MNAYKPYDLSCNNSLLIRQNITHLQRLSIYKKNMEKCNVLSELYSYFYLRIPELL